MASAATDRLETVFGSVSASPAGHETGAERKNLFGLSVGWMATLPMNEILREENTIRARHKTSAAELDIDLVNKSLAHVNNFSRRRQAEKLQPVLMYEIPCEGESFYRTMSLRELLNYVNSEASAIDQAYWAVERHRLKHGRTSSNASPPRAAMKEGESVSSPPLSLQAASEEGIGSAGAEEDYAAVSELRLRDLRRLDYQFNPNEEKSILIRKHAVLFAMVSLLDLVFLHNHNAD